MTTTPKQFEIAGFTFRVLEPKEVIKPNHYVKVRSNAVGVQSQAPHFIGCTVEEALKYVASQDIPGPCIF